MFKNNYHKSNSSNSIIFRIAHARASFNKTKQWENDTNYKSNNSQLLSMGICCKTLPEIMVISSILYITRVVGSTIRLSQYFISFYFQHFNQKIDRYIVHCWEILRTFSMPIILLLLQIYRRQTIDLFAIPSKTDYVIHIDISIKISVELIESSKKRDFFMWILSALFLSLLLSYKQTTNWIRVGPV